METMDRQTIIGLFVMILLSTAIGYLAAMFHG